MVNVNISEGWQNKFSGSHIGMQLIEKVDNSKRGTPLDERKKEIESRVSEKYDG